MEEIREILQTIAQSTLATTSAAEAVKKAVEDKKSSTTDWSTLIAKPNIFDYKSQEEEVKAFREWSWVFEKDLRRGIHERQDSRRRIETCNICSVVLLVESNQTST